MEEDHRSARLMETCSKSLWEVAAMITARGMATFSSARAPKH